jgi:hypothetical protein
MVLSATQLSYQLLPPQTYTTILHDGPQESPKYKDDMANAGMGYLEVVGS